MKGIATLLILTFSPLSALMQTTRPQTAPKPTATPNPKTQTAKPAPKATPKPTPKNSKPSTASKGKPAPTPTPKDPKVELEKAIAYQDPEERLVAFQDYLAFFPNSPDVKRVKELMVSARGEMADKLLQEGEAEDGIEMFKTAVVEAPAPVSDELFSKVILKFPAAAFAREQRKAAFEIAAAIEELAGSNTKQLLGLATFYLSVQYGTEAIRIATKAVEISPDLPLAYYTLGAATRLNFRLDEAAAAYAKALELEPASMSSRRNLADISRALGKSEDAEKLYREILAKDESDQTARSALALALFDLGKREEAEVEMTKALAENPSDARLLSGAAFWYAANGEPAKAVELGQKAHTANPAYTWAYIAEARGHIAQKNPLEAERVLLIAKATGNFPTLNYEIAAARYSAGLYREAVEILAASFEFKDGLVSTYLGNRVLADSESITDLLRLERKTAVLEAKIPDDPATASRLIGLLAFSTALAKDDAVSEADTLKGAERFIGEKDNMQPHRQLFVASRLLSNKIAVAKAAEFTKAAVPGLDESLKVPAPVAAVLADELYETRVSALSRGEMVIVPEVSQQTLISVMRGRIEELTGWSFLLQQDPAQAALRFRRGLTVLPEKSVWWRSSLWRLGNALEDEKKPKEAIEAYIRAYDKDNPDREKYFYIERLFFKSYGTTNGLIARIGDRPATADGEAPSPDAGASGQTAQKIPDSVPFSSVDEKANSSSGKLPENVPNAVSADEPPPKVDPAALKKSAPDAFDDVDGDQAANELAASSPQAPKPPPVKPIKSAPALPEVSTQTLPTPEVGEAQQKSAASQTTEQEDALRVKSSAGDSNKAQAAQETSAPKTDSSTKNKPEQKTDDADDQPKSKPAGGNPTSAPARARVVGTKTGEEGSNGCVLIPTRDAVTIFPNGGLWGLLVDLKNGDSKQLSASSENPDDISVKKEASPAGETRTFFVIRSISSRTGDFKVLIKSPCATKEIAVSVRGL